MTIQTILQRKGADVVVIDAAQSVAEAVRVMDKRQIGALLVAGEDAPESGHGIFTERDVLRALAGGGAEILHQPVAQHMTARPQVISPETTVLEAMEIMTEKRYRHLPVMMGDTLCGIVSLGDLVNYRIQRTEQEAEALKAYIKTG